MTAVQFSSIGLSDALSAANVMASSLASTVSGNAGWLILIATVGLFIWFVLMITASLARLGRGGTDIAIGNKRLQMDNVPLSRFDFKEARRVRGIEKREKKEKGWGRRVGLHALGETKKVPFHGNLPF